MSRLHDTPFPAEGRMLKMNAAVASLLFMAAWLPCAMGDRRSHLTNRAKAVKLRSWRLVLASPLLLLAYALSADATAQESHREQLKLNQDIDKALREENLVGAVWATVDEKGLIDTGAIGAKNAVSGEQLTPESKVHVGSLSKSLLSVGILQLATAGRINLDSPVEHYLPTLKMRNQWRATHPVLVRHLLDHTAGLDDIRLWQLFSAEVAPDVPLQDAFNRDPKVLSIRSQPGSRFSYSNMGYTLAAMVIEEVTNERYELWLDRELLRPLGMRDSTFEFTTQVGPTADKRLAWGHHDVKSPVSALPVYLRPAGQFTSTAYDLALFARFLLGDGIVKGRLIVRTDLLRSMGRASTTDAVHEGLEVGYALGMKYRDRHGVVGLCHDGSVVGFRSQLCVFPDEKAAQQGKAFVIVINTDGDGANVGRFDALMVNALGVPSSQRLRPSLPLSQIGHWTGRYVPSPNRMEYFRYIDFLFDSLQMSWDGSVLRLAPMQGKARVLTPVGDKRFMASDRTMASHVLLMSSEGERFLSDGQRTYQRVEAASYWLVAASLGFGLVGVFWFLLVIPMYSVVCRKAIRDPGVYGVALPVASVPLFFLQAYTQLGDKTIASVALYVGTAALPILLLWQVWRSYRSSDGLIRKWSNLIAAVLVLQWCLALASWGLLPFALWA